ncbi:C-terminal binding protein [candidate division KSB1 bacterium]|nr:C-terminal binding protein [candidate division KSB1 bacterium]
MEKKIMFKVTDFIERDLKWEEEQCKDLDIEFQHYQLRDASAAELIETFKDADGLLTNMARFDAEVMAGIDNVKLLIRHGIGYDNVDVRAATENGIVFANEATASSEDVAEHTLMLIFDTFRKKKIQERMLNFWIKTRKWSSDSIYPLYRLKGKTLGIIGCGNIGSRVLKRVSGFGMNVLVCDPYLTAARWNELGSQHTDFETVLKQADVVAIHVPVTEETRHMFNRNSLRLMKKSAILINTARGAIVNTADLIDALKKGVIAGAGLDVYEDEPPPPDFELLNMENVILSPHVAWYSEEGGWDIRYMILDDIKAFLEGRLPQFVINPEVLKSPKLKMKWQQ